MFLIFLGVGVGQVYTLSCLAVRFMLRHADADLIALITGSVPPVDASKVSIFASFLSKFQTEVGFRKKTAITHIIVE